MIRVINEPIPAHKMEQFHEVLCACGGRYCSIPRNCTKDEGCFRVDYVYDSQSDFVERWKRCTSDVKEIRKDQWWRKFFRRLLHFTERKQA